MNKLETKGVGNYKVFIVGGNPIHPEYQVEFPNSEQIFSSKPSEITVEIVQVTLSDGRDAIVHISSLTKHSPHNIGQVMDFEELIERDVLNEFGGPKDEVSLDDTASLDGCCGGDSCNHEAKTIPVEGT